jgi:hypothetical protein
MANFKINLTTEEREAFILVCEKLTSLIKEASPENKEINYMLFTHVLVETNDVMRSIITGNLKRYQFHADKEV